ncbi:MAG: ArsR family transcriptional regulator [Saprospiraceae bacterium]|jgi:DNA-binding transcriptional ArsR family regulator
MGLTKTEIFTEDQNRVAAIAKVIGHPARVAILQYLAAKNSCVCGELVNEIGLAQPTISQHLKELKKIGILKGSIDGTSVCYCIDQSVLSEIKSVFMHFFETCSSGSSEDGCC